MTFDAIGLPHCPHGTVLLPVEAVNAEHRTCRKPLLRHLSTLCRFVHPVRPASESSAIPPPGEVMRSSAASPRKAAAPGV